MLDFGLGLATSLTTRYGARLHMDPFPQVGYVFLNVNAPPFDDVRVRRALNYAVDRARVARLTGGPDILQPTCQLLPPGFQGYTPACPFTVTPTAPVCGSARTWRRPAGSWRRPARAACGSSSGAASRGRGSGGTSGRCCAGSAIAASSEPSPTST